MASQSLYRKWRSQTFSDLVGQEASIRTLKNAVNTGNLSHAYLFTGPRGTGKTSMARLLAKTINCLNSHDGEPCNVCDQCREITAGSSFNVIEIDAASNRGIDSIRELRDKVMMPPATGKYKVYILDEAHMLTTEAFNALLKTLEEPPPHAIFVLATTDVHKLLPTVLSRCQRFDFKRFTLKQLIDRLNYVAAEEQVALEQGAAELLARAASGGMRDALSLLDQAIAYSGQSISLAQIQTMLGVADPRAIQKLILHIAQLESPEGLHLIHTLSEAGADLRQVNTQVAEFFRAMMLARAGADVTEILDNTADEIKEIQEIARLFALEELTECARVFAQNELMQKNLGTPQLGLELALLACIELHRRKGNVDVSTHSFAPTAAASHPARTSEPPARQQPVQPPAPTRQQPPAPARVESYPPSSPVRQEPAPTRPAPVAASPVPPEIPTTPPSTIEMSPGSDDDEHDEPEISADAELPEWDTLSYVEEDEEPADAPLPSAPVHAATPPAETVPVTPPSESLIPAVPVTPYLAEQAEADFPALTVQDVKEKWEYIKRRVRSKSTKDGPLIQALLNNYTVLAIEGTRESPVVVLRAGADFHYKRLQDNEERRQVIEWAMKVELQQTCRVKLIAPGQSGSSMIIPPPSTPSDGSNGNTLYSSMMARSRNSAFQERPATEKRPSSVMPSQPLAQVETLTQSPPRLVSVQEAQAPVSRPPATSPELHPPSPPLARMHIVRENTTGEKKRTEESSMNRQARVEQQGRGDPVAQEIVRLFKANIKEIRPK
ncbi:MAG TPA: DNA polymerase III subunit gamma/tau [Ktedonobacteraceae bacterium]|jgi:DNA polymerase-3 subunit gamma/tau|nr:DNA polymerase III subunit gamma/tau [Ktedonobacteraceae bacterium]